MSAGLAPVVLVAGWVLAGAAQPAGYDAVRQTISALAARGADHRWIMTTGLAGLGVAHVVTSLGLRGARRSARAVLAAAGVATLGVAVFAEPAHGSSGPHAVCATVAFVLLAVWPATLVGGDADVPWPQRRRVGLAVALLSIALLVWFAVTLSHGPLGVSERVLSGQQALWPLVVVLVARGRVARMAA